MDELQNTEQVDRLLTAKKRLLSRLKHGSPAPAKVNKLKLSDVQSLPSVFQHRSNNQAASESHVLELIKHLERHPEQPFSPLVVYWVGDGWCVIDGHHRLEAYKAMDFKQAFPVTVFSGTLDDALILSLSSNAKDKLTMSRIEKSNAAWRLVISTDNSKAAIAKAACVSDRNVGYMRAVFKALSEQHPELALDDLSWIDAMRMYQGKRMDNKTGTDDWVEKEAQVLADRLCKQFGKRLSQNFEVTMLALEKYDCRLPQAIADYYAPAQDDDEWDAPVHQLAEGEEF